MTVNCNQGAEVQLDKGNLYVYEMLIGNTR